MDKFNDELTALIAQYREALPDPDPSAEFMPKLWNRIDARRSFTFRIRRLTQIFVAGAAAMCLAMTGLMALPSNHRQEIHSTYIDVLAEAQPPESLAAAGIVRDTSEPNFK